MKCWGGDVSVHPRPASSLKLGYLPHGSIVRVIAPESQYRKSRPREYVPSEVSERHLYYRLTSFHEAPICNGYVKVQAQKGTSTDNVGHCFVEAPVGNDETKALAKRLLSLLPLGLAPRSPSTTEPTTELLENGHFQPQQPPLMLEDGSGDSDGKERGEDQQQSKEQLEIMLASASVSRPGTRAGVMSPSLNRRDGFKESVPFENALGPEVLAEYDENYRKAKPGYIFMSYAKGCRNEEHVSRVAKMLERKGWRTWMDEVSVLKLSELYSESGRASLSFT